MSKTDLDIGHCTARAYIFCRKIEFCNKIQKYEITKWASTSGITGSTTNMKIFCSNVLNNLSIVPNFQIPSKLYFSHNRLKQFLVVHLVGGTSVQNFMIVPPPPKGLSSQKYVLKVYLHYIKYPSGKFPASRPTRLG